MALATFLTAMLAAGMAAAKSPEPVSIYVGPHVREGFVDVDQGVLDSIKDIQKHLRKLPLDKRKDATFRVVSNESEATLKLYVIRRGFGAPTAGVGVQPAPTVALYLPVHARFVEAVLRVGEYERPLIGEDRDHENWGRCARLLVDDLSAWVVANRERIP